MQLVLNTYGLQLSQHNRCFRIQSKTESNLISPVRITSILITKAANITSSALILAAENDIPVILVNSVGQPVVKINPVLAAGHSALRKKQYEFTKSAAAVGWIIRLLLLKTEQQISNLAWWANRKPSIATVCLESKKRLIASEKSLLQMVQQKSVRTELLQALRGWEGSNARFYWQAMANLARGEGWKMQGRSYHPADDEINAALNYLYGMLYHQVETALASAGLDSQLGLWHRDEYQTPSLSFDVIEPLRPKVDKLLSEILMRHQLKAEWFEPDEKYGYILNRQGKKILIPLFNEWLEQKLKMQNLVTAAKNHILQQAYNLRKEIEKTELYE